MTTAIPSLNESDVLAFCHSINLITTKALPMKPKIPHPHPLNSKTKKSSSLYPSLSPPPRSLPQIRQIPLILIPKLLIRDLITLTPSSRFLRPHTRIRIILRVDIVKMIIRSRASSRTVRKLMIRIPILDRGHGVVFSPAYGLAAYMRVEEECGEGRYTAYISCRNLFFPGIFSLLTIRSTQTRTTPCTRGTRPHPYHRPSSSDCRRAITCCWTTNSTSRRRWSKEGGGWRLGRG